MDIEGYIKGVYKRGYRKAAPGCNGLKSAWLNG